MSTSEESEEVEILDKDDLYIVMVKNGWYLPSKSSTMCTATWMKQVVRGEAYCFNFADIRLRPCPVPPKKEVLLEELN